MLALDSSVLLRFLTRDDPGQAQAARELLVNSLNDERPGYVSIAVLCETAWTLRRVYGFNQAQIRHALSRLLTVPQLVFGDDLAVRAALEGETDLVNLLIHELGRRAGCSETVTFDRRFARLPGVRLLEG